MKKLIKIVVTVIVVLVLVVLAAVLTLPLWLGPVVKPSANMVVPKITKTAFSLGHLSLNPYTGRFELGDVLVGNPEGYAEPYAVALSNLVVDVDMSTLGSQQIHVSEVTLDGCFVSYVFGGEHGVDNIKQLQYNVAGGKEKYEAAQAKKKAEAERKEAASQQAAPAKEGESSSLAQKVVIDRLTIRGIRVKIAKVTMPVPAITLTDLGKKSGGVTVSEVLDQCWAAILKSATSLNEGLKTVGDTVKSLELGGKANKTVETVTSQAGKAVEKADAAVKSLKGLFTK